MKTAQQTVAKELYAKLRRMTCLQLWNEEVPRFDRANPRERMNSVALIRAVGVVFSETGTAAQQEEARAWLRGLLHDQEEKVRRYAMTALPKLGSDVGLEAGLLKLLAKEPSERERKFVARALDKVGGAATLQALQQGAIGVPAQTELKVKASRARQEEPSSLLMEAAIPGGAGLIHLRCRRGLEFILREEVEAQGKFAVVQFAAGLVVVNATGPFALADIYELRCFASVGVFLGEAPSSTDALAGIITSARALEILRTWTSGSLRYRITFVDQGHQRGTVRALANRAYALCPQILNDAKEAPWSIEIRGTGERCRVELSPRLRPDPRFAYRRGDIPAASHPPLAACMARLAGRRENEVVWDPFCGSGLELVERTRLGGVRKVFGTDLSAEAVAIAAENFAGARLTFTDRNFACADFRDFRQVEGLQPGSVTLIITNPPMGKRVPIPNLRGLINDLFSVAVRVLQPGGRLVFPNPLHMENPHASLLLEFRQVLDLGGFDCRLEVYRRA